ncbi:hypothetical protein K435DRAFT_804357 [Dendrothele bispora CBS 962.96]|uniref:Uncharacterized protein n=1 Tax=Dendrothele bispora (strain CBS 962.96) TaxID=1314807 RepID=A0A4S8LEP1_DENBC|nr:hypothetical protein K435DRAFT_804357 [Dendrothele bispora CBS 962.96]
MSGSFFQQASQNVFRGSTIINVGGDFSGQVGSIVSPGARGESIFDEFRIIRRGDIYHLNEISREEVDEEREAKHSPYRYKLRDQLLRFTRTAYRVKLIGTDGPPGSHIALTYRGRDAQAAWERDFSLYSNPHPNLPHLFGLNHSDTPAMIFHDGEDVDAIWNDSLERFRSFELLFSDYTQREGWEVKLGSEHQIFVKRDTGLICFAPHITDWRESLVSIHDASYQYLPFPKGEVLWGTHIQGPISKPLPFQLCQDEQLVASHILQNIEQSPGTDFLDFILRSREGHRGGHSSDRLRDILPISLPFICDSADNKTHRVAQFSNINVELSPSSSSKHFQAKVSKTSKHDTPTVFCKMTSWNSAATTVITETGWTRPFPEPCFRFEVEISDEKQDLLPKAWLSQAKYLNVTMDIPSLDKNINQMELTRLMLIGETVDKISTTGH